jgi:hypothetical protein
MKNIPFFELNGKKYEIKRNRYLQAEFDEMKNDLEMSNEEQISYSNQLEMEDKIRKLSERKDELYNKYIETFSDEDLEMYEKANKAYNVFIEQYSEMQNIVGKQRKAMIDIGEKLIIKALQIDNEGNKIRSEEEATTIWEDFVVEYGQYTSMEFVIFTINYIIGNDDEIENPFIAQAKAKAEQKANMKKGIQKVK